MFRNCVTWYSLMLLLSLSNVTAAYELIGTIRDFKRGDEEGGHPDFETQLGADFDIVEEVLGPGRKPMYNGDPTTSTTTGEENFDQWYRDVPDVNQGRNLSITLIETGGNFLFDNQAFFPIDDEFFGNQGLAHNQHFTTEYHAKFTYTSLDDFLRVGGDDDVWLFIDNQLAVNLGGVRSSQTAFVQFGALELTVGQMYDLDLFHAERRTPGSSLVIDTSLVLTPRLPGDYNDNGNVDAADYTLWRDNLGTTFQLLNEGPGVSPGMVSNDDYDVWKSNFGTTAGSGALTAVAVPEPQATYVAAFFLAMMHRRCYHCRNGRRSLRPVAES